MLTHRGIWLGVVVALTACKKPQAPATQDDPLQAAIENQGGLARLKSISAYSASYRISWPGATPAISGKLQQKNGAMRVEHVVPYGDRVIITTGERQCWRQQGQVVIPCAPEARTHASRLGSLLEASLLWPLKQRTDRKVTTESVQVAGLTYDGLVVSDGQGTRLGTLLVDRSTFLVVGLRMETTIRGKPGELVGSFSDFEKSCHGMQIATRRTYTFASEPLLVEQLGGVLCENLDDKLFQTPPQVKSGHVQLKHKDTADLACASLRGPLTGVDSAIKKVGDYLTRFKLSPVGPPVLIHRKGPPRVRQPAQFVTDVCLPVGKQAWLMPEHIWKGEITRHDVLGDEVLAAFGTGSPEKTTTELPALLAVGARERQRKQIGTLIQILHMHRDDIPVDQRVSEMHATLE